MEGWRMSDQPGFRMAPAQKTVFPVVPSVADLSKKRKNKSSSTTGAKKQKRTSAAEASDPSVRGSAQDSNQLDLLAITYPSGPSEQHMDDKRTSQQQHKKKRAIKKN
ncbi:uncharacterized protein LOC120657984 [Panicum virgatum]|uniref:uncharacterized protein LOC120657984 n=1 Tax=Panicum virgatum TaxID=38727 RepID=UPI0019D5D723|nr:uncharacterized protein LOC120657984 [Panicum virgatum]